MSALICPTWGLSVTSDRENQVIARGVGHRLGGNRIPSYVFVALRIIITLPIKILPSDRSVIPSYLRIQYLL